MLRISKKFGQKNHLLYANLEKFLDWRFQNMKKSLTESKNPNLEASFSYRLTEPSFKIKKQNKKFYKPVRFSQKNSSANFLNSESFFPEKKSFMQFWTLPLVGASVLSFLAFQNNESKTTTLLDLSTENKTILNFSRESGSRKTKNLNLTRLTNSNLNQDNFYKSSYPIFLEQTEKQSRLDVQKNQLEKLCRFYLNLTEHKLSQSDSLDILSTANDKEFEKNLFLTRLYSQNSLFHWYFYPLYNSNEISMSAFTPQDNKFLELFTQKLNPIFKSGESFDLFENVPKNWKTHPTLSYLKSSEILEIWLKNLKFETSKNLKSQNLNSLLNRSALPEFTEQNKKQSALTNLYKKSSTVDFFNQFLENWETKKRESLESYQNLRNPNSLNELHSNKISQNSFEKRFFDSFEKKYKSALFQFYMKNQLEQSKYNSTRNFKFQTLKSKKTRQKQQLKEILKQTLFRNLQDNNLRQIHSSLLFFKDLTDSNKKEMKHNQNLESQLKNFLFELSILKNLNLESGEKDLSIKNYTNLKNKIFALKKDLGNFEAQVTENLPNKLVQDLNLYVQFEHIYQNLFKTLEDKNTKTTSENMTSLKNKSMIYFANKNLKQFNFRNQISPMDIVVEPNQIQTNFKERKSYNLETFLNLKNVNQDLVNLISKRNLENVKNLSSFSNTLTKLQIDLGKQTSTLLERKNFFEKNMRQFQLQTNVTLASSLGLKQEKRLLKLKFKKPLSRKTEKIFRTYLSIKNSQGLQTQKVSKFRLKTEKNFLGNQPLEKTKIYGILHKLKTRSLEQNMPEKKWSNSRKKVFIKTVFSQKLQPAISQKKFATSFIGGKTRSNFNDSIYFKEVSQFSFLKKADFLKNSDDLRLFEKKKTMEKKRRLKKLKLENRRRKKRKRFYPRPHYLRFELYSKFLQNRHRWQSETTGNLQKENSSKLSTILTGSSKTQHLNYTNFSKNIYGRNQLNLETQVGTRLPCLFNSTVRQKELYKISNETLTEFERLCWKSYWLRSNLKPYVLKIQKSLKRMKDMEHLKQNSINFSGFFDSFTHQIPSKISKNDSNSRSLSMVPVYLNIHKTFAPKFSEQLPTTHLFKQIVNRAEYEKVLYERINDEIKNVKSQLTVEGQSQARSYKTGRQKLEKTLTKPFWNAPYAFLNNYLEPSLNTSTSLLNSPFIRTDFGTKSFPTLRLLWACQKTQLFTYQPNNMAQNLWSIYKKREQTKNNQTRKFLYRFSRKMGDFKNSLIMKHSNKNIESSFENSNMNTSTPNFKNQLKNLKIQNLAVNKTNWVNQKVQTFGGLLLGKNYESYLKTLKFQLQKNPLSKQEMILKEKGVSTSLQTRDNLFQPLNAPWFSTNMENFIQKRQFHFWWSLEKPKTEFPFLLSSPFLFSNPENAFLYSSNFGFLSQATGLHNELIARTFWISACGLHLAIFFALVRIPEIRSLLKFQVLILSKLCNAYLLGIFAFYDLLKNYAKKIQQINQKLFKVYQFESSEYLKPQGKFTQFQISEFDLPFKTLEISKLKRNIKSLDFSETSSNLKFSKTWIQSTVHWDFVFKSFTNFEQKMPANVTVSLDQVNFAKLTSISSLYGKTLKTGTSKKQEKLPLKGNQIYHIWASEFFWNFTQKNLDKQKFLTQKTQFQKAYNSQTVFTKKDSSTKSMSTQKEKSFSYMTASNIQIQSFLSLMVLGLTRLTFSAFYLCLTLFYKIVFQMIDVLEGILLIFYKFLEKPAEVMVDWIAEVFLIEWTSDIYTYIPEAFDTSMWTSVTKFSRSSRFFYSLPFGFVMQRFFLESSQIFYAWLLKPDADLLMRQKKGVIFWDIWSEVLIQAAEQYKMNLSSLSTVKEEQELLIENLLEQKPSSKEPSSKLTQKESFLNQQVGSSLSKLEPLMKFIHNAPAFYTPSKINPETEKFALFAEHKLPWVQALKFGNLKSETSISSTTFKENTLKRWAVSQYLNTQGKDTDLFMDIYPPKSFSHVSFLKSYLPSQEILGSLTCEIYSGLFASKISKNILIVGAPGMAKSFFIQALAGETELKIVLDNAHRYAFVNGGVPVGMKLLREVFDSIALHTPCLFLLEDIHVIGERRPMLISDDETSKTKEVAFGAEQEEVHEKNKLIYQLSKHALSHYKKPYKGDFSLAIPTNHFCYDLFLGVAPPRKRRADLSVSSPLPVQQLDQTLNGSGMHTNEPGGVSSGNVGGSTEIEQKTGVTGHRTLLSSLEISASQVFAPPATSPFHVLLMKEQKKLKPQKLVRDVPWSGLSYDQWMLLSKTQYSVRVKVALLAETALKNLSVKLDMITDLLVIIDSVRSNRGFVVFATTHLPALLDPALRRPGRLDETISLPLLPNIQTRFEIFKTRLSSYTQTLDFFDWSLYSAQTKQNENQLSNFLNKNILLLLNAKHPINSNKLTRSSSNAVFKNFFNDYPIYSLSQAFQSSLSLSSLWINANMLKKMISHQQLDEVNKTDISKSLNQSSQNKSKTKVLATAKFTGTDMNNYLALSYAQAGQFLTEALLVKDQTAYSMKFLGNLGLQEFSQMDRQKFMYQSLYSSNFETQTTLFKLFSAKISQFFIFQSFNPALSSANFNSQKIYFENDKLGSGLSLEKLRTNPSQGAIFENLQNSLNYWQSATNVLDALFQKRYLYNKNSIVFKMLFFEDQVILGDPPSPPNSTILMPARKFENYKRTLRDFIQKPGFSINQKLQMHQKQRFLKLLYNVPVQTSFVSASKNQNQKLESTNFYSSFKDLAYLDQTTLRPSASYAFYKNRIFNRQRFSLLNQWWNGQLAEHNAETTYLSHIDWRSIFVPSIGDVFLDFPDAEQYYNPRHRRWFLQSETWSYWLNFETDYRQKISDHFLMECWTKTTELLNSNRELFDYLAYAFLRNHELHELDLLQVLVRFYQKDSIK